MIIVTVIVGLEMVVMTIGTAIRESRITANATLVDDNRQNVSRIYSDEGGTYCL